MAEKNYGVHINLNKNQLLNAAMQVLNMFPSSPARGQFVFNTVTNNAHVHDGTNWLNLSTSEGNLTLLTAAVDTVSRSWTSKDLNDWALTNPGNLVTTVNLGLGTATRTTRIITSSTGNGATVPSATTAYAGLLSADDKVKLDGIDPGANQYELLPATSTRLGGVMIGTNVQVTPAGLISINTANGSTTGVLTGADWTAFNGKQNALTGTGFVKSVAGVISYDTSSYAVVGHSHNTSDISSLSGYVIGTNVAIAAVDSLNTALGKIQAQINSKSSTTGTVTSVGMTIPTGLAISGSPITTAGVLALSMASGYSIPTTANQLLWTAGYNGNITGVTLTSTLLTLTKQDASTITTSVPIFNQSTTGNAATATVLAATRTINGTGFNGSINIETSYWGTSRNLTIGSSTKAVNGSTNVSWSLAEIGAAASSHTHTWAQITGTPNTIVGYGITDAYTKTEVDNKLTSVYKSKGSVANFAALPTTGNTAGDVWNLLDNGDNYVWVLNLNNTSQPGWDKLAGITDLTGYVPISRKLSINGVQLDLSTDRAWTVPTGTVTSVGLSVPPSLTVTNSPITSSGIIALGVASGYVIPTQTLLDSKNASLVTAASAAGVANAVTGNTNTFLNIVQGSSSPGSSTKVTGAGSITVASDASGILTITGTNNTYVAGTGLTLTGNSFAVNYGTTVGTAAAGNDPRFHNPVTISTANGLSINNQALSLALATPSAAGAMSAADKTKLDGLGSDSYEVAFGSLTQYSYDINHDLGTRSVTVQIYEDLSGKDIEMEVIRSTPNKVIINLNTLPDVLNKYIAVVKR